MIHRGKSGDLQVNPQGPVRTLDTTRRQRRDSRRAPTDRTICTPLLDPTPCPAVHPGASRCGSWTPSRQQQHGRTSRPAAPLGDLCASLARRCDGSYSTAEISVSRRHFVGRINRGYVPSYTTLWCFLDVDHIARGEPFPGRALLGQ